MRQKTMLCNRTTRKLEEESLGNQKFLVFLNQSYIGRLLLKGIFKRKFFSKLSGLYYCSRFSVPKIKRFIKKYNIKVNEIEQPVKYYKSFNAFFTRRLVEGVRPIDKRSNVLIAPADSRMIYYKLKKGSIISAKGMQYTLGELIQDKDLSKEYQGGICLVFRLAPTDYHRFCMNDDCKQGNIIKIPGDYNTVRTSIAPVNVVVTNYREYAILETKHFGKVIQVEIGAMQIGRIHQVAAEGGFFHKGDEKGYFEYGGSTIIQIYEKKAIVLDKDIIKNSHKGIETIVKQGASIGHINVEK